MNEALDIERRLRNLATTGEPDWLDVRRRARVLGGRHRRYRTPLLAAAAVLVLAAGATAGIRTLTDDGAPLVDQASVAPVPQTVPADVSFIAGSRLQAPGRPPVQLPAPLFAPLLGNEAPLAVVSPDGEQIGFHTWSNDTPALRVVDLDSGSTEVLASGAQSLAWAEQIAYFRGLNPQLDGGAYLGRIEVVANPGSDPEIWTPTPAEYSAIAWAGSNLLVDVNPCALEECAGTPTPGVYAMQRPGELRPLDMSDVAAVSPSGHHVLGTHLASPGSDAGSSVLWLQAVADGEVVDTIDLSKAARGKASPDMFDQGIKNAVWRGDTVAGISTSGNTSVLTFLSASNDRLAFDQVIQLNPDDLSPSKRAVYFTDLSFDGGGTNRVVVAMRQGDEVSIATCDRTTLACTRGPAVPDEKWLALVQNPSR